MPRKRAKESVRRARREMYRALVLEAAERVFARAGFDDAKMQDIAAEAGLSLGTVYASFPGKSEIFRSIHEARGRELLDLAREATQRGATPRRTLHDGIAAYVEYLTRHPDYLRMHLRDGTAWGLGGHFASREQATAWREGQELQAALFQRGVEQGEFVDDDPALMGRTLTAMHQVQLADWLEDGMQREPGELVRRMQEQAERLFCRQAGEERS